MSVCATTHREVTFCLAGSRERDGQNVPCLATALHCSLCVRLPGPLGTPVVRLSCNSSLGSAVREKGYGGELSKKKKSWTQALGGVPR